MPVPKTALKTLDSLTRTAAFVLERLGHAGIEHAEVAVGVGSELEVGVRRGDVELVKEAQSSGLSVRVMRDERVATSSTTDLRRDSLQAFVDRVVEMASLSEPDPMAAPPEPSALVRKWPDLDLFDPRTDRIDAAKGIAMATTAERAAFNKSKKITASEGASFSRSSGHSVLATSGGFVGTSSGTYQSLVVQAVADDEGGKKRAGFYWTGGRFFSELERPAAVGRQAAERAVATLGARKMKTGVVPVVFDQEAARAIVGLVASCVLGDSVYRQRSYLGSRLGQSIASTKVTLIDDPLIARAPGSRPYDGEGRKVKKRVVCRRGELQTFLLDTYSARQLGLSPTGSSSGGGGIPHASTSNFYLQAGRKPPEALLRGIERGLYVTRMMGHGFDPVTGNFSRGAEGFLIEHGERTTPVSEITISRNLDELLHGVDAVANDLVFKTSIAAPSFRVDAMTVAGD